MFLGHPYPYIIDPLGDPIFWIFKQTPNLISELQDVGPNLCCIL